MQGPELPPWMGPAPAPGKAPAAPAGPPARKGGKEDRPVKSYNPLAREEGEESDEDSEVGSVYSESSEEYDEEVSAGGGSAAPQYPPTPHTPCPQPLYASAFLVHAVIKLRVPPLIRSCPAARTVSRWCASARRFSRVGFSTALVDTRGAGP